MNHFIQMLPFYFAGLNCLLIGLSLRPELLAIKSGPIKTFLKYIFAVTLVRIALAYTDPSHIKATFDSSSFFSLFMVWWEDCLFVLPLLLFRHYFKSTTVFFLFTLVSSIGFASGHLSYSVEWASFLLLYVYFFSYRNGLKHGLGTVIVCHIIYDLATVLTQLLV